MSVDPTPSQPPRREFLGQLGVAASALVATASLAPLFTEAEAQASAGSWDLSWVDKISRAKYSAVFDMNIMNGPGQNNATTFLDQFHEVYNTRDEETRVVLVMRQLGTPMAFNDALWERYPIGEDSKTNDPKTKTFAKRNTFWPRYDASWTWPDDSLERFTERGGIVVVCNIATQNWARSMAKLVNRDAAEVTADVKRNLIPGAVLVPSGIFALIRAQNAGAAFMRG